MKASIITAAGSPSVLQIQERPTPTFSDHEVLISVKAAGINRPDIMQREGKYPPPPDAPQDIPGLEVAGVIGQVGNKVTGWKVGDRVCALVAGGGYAEQTTAHENLCLPIPDQISFEEAAGLPETIFTVWHNVFRLGALKTGEHLLLHGGSSGIGMTAIQLAKAIGAEVTVTVGTLEKGEACMAIGADQYILYKETDFEQELKETGVDVILDMVGGSYFEKNISILRPDGRLVYINAMNGAKVPLDLWQIMRKRIRLTGSTLRNRDLAFKTELRNDILQNAWPFLQNGRLKTIIYKTFHLHQADQAHQLMESSQHIGKIILKID